MFYCHIFLTGISASGKSGGVGSTLDCTDRSINVVDGYVFCNGIEHEHPQYTTRVSEVCGGLETCKIGYNIVGNTCPDCNDIRVSDPCPGVIKNFHVEYDCSSKVPGKDFKLISTRGDQIKGKKECITKNMLNLHEQFYVQTK